MKKRILALAVVISAATGMLGALISPLAAFAAPNWSAPVSLTSTTSDLNAPAILPLSDTTFMSAWNNSSTGKVQSSISSDSGLTWSVPVDIDSTAAGAPLLVTDGQGGAVLVYRKSDSNNNTQILSARYSSTNSSWSLNGVLSTQSTNNTTRGSSGFSASYSNGFVGVVWVESDAATSTSWIQATSLSLSSNTPVTGPIDLMPTTTPVNFDPRSPAISSSGTNFVATWLTRDSTNSPYRAAVSYSNNSGATWSAPATDPVPSTKYGFLTASGTTSVQTNIRGGANNTFVASIVTSNGSNLVVTTRTSTDGGVNWAQPSQVSLDGHNSISVEILQLPNGNWLATYDASINSVRQTRVALSANAGTTWTGQTTISDIATGTRAPRVAVAPNGIITIVYSTGTQFVTNQSSDNGATWSTSLVVGTGAPASLTPNIVSSGANTFVITWTTTSFSGQAVSQLNPSATPSLPETGIDLGPAAFISLSAGISGVLLLRLSRKTLLNQ